VKVDKPSDGDDSYPDVDDPPAAANDTATVAEDSGPSAVDVLANDLDPDGGPKSIESVTQPDHGTVQTTGGGTGLSYEPDPDYCNDPGGEADEFEYTLAPGGSTATVAVTVSCVDDPTPEPSCGPMPGDCSIYSYKFWELLERYKPFEIAPAVYPYPPECMEAWANGEQIFCIAAIAYLYPDGTTGIAAWTVDPCAPKGGRLLGLDPDPYSC
jgi:hypothetical protein